MSAQTCGGRSKGRHAGSFCAILLAALMGACDSRVPLRNDSLATIDYWPEERMLFVASPQSGSIDMLRVADDGAHSNFRFVDRLVYPSRLQVVRLSIDRRHGRLWVADSRMLYVYELKPRIDSRRVVLPIPPEMPISDLVLDGAGDALVFVRGGAEIYKVRQGTLEATRWLEIVPRSHPWSFGGRVALTTDGRELLFASPRDGRLVRLDIASRQMQVVDAGSPPQSRCGSMLWRDDSHAVAADRQSLALIHFDCRGSSVSEIAFDRTFNQTAEHAGSATR